MMEYLDWISQAGIFIFGVGSILLAGFKSKWAFVVGLISQPFWYYTAIYHHQPGVVLASVAYTVSWSIGFYNWFLKKQDTHERFTISQWGLLMRDGKCLILKSAHQDFWELPGGRIEVNELMKHDAESALRREIKEELGFEKCEIKGLLGRMIGHSQNKKTPVCRMIYLIKNDSEQITLSHEHSEMKWVTKDEIKNYNFYKLINSIGLDEILTSAFQKI